MLFLLLLLSAAAAAQSTNQTGIGPESGINQVDSIVMDIDPSGMVSVTEDVSVTRGNIVSILVPEASQNLLVVDSKGSEIKYESVPRDDRELVSFQMDESGSDKYGEVELKYFTQHMTGKTGDLWNFSYKTTATPFITSINLRMPNNTRIAQIDFSDFNWAPKSDSELWIYPTIENFHLAFTYKIGVPGPIIPKPGATTTTSTITTTTTTQPEGSKSMDLTFIVFISIIFGVLVLFSVLFLRRKGMPVKEEKQSSALKPDTGGEIYGDHPALTDPAEVASEGLKEVYQYVPMSTPGVVEMGQSQHSRAVKDSIVNVLDENEKKVVKMLEGSDDEITQAYIYKSTGIPKSSLSDTIKRLEKRNILEVKKEGRTNWIKLKDWVLS